ncbi:formylglycine-generating enzyme family protein [Posidoniimonas corsicana]|uniref:formylglycine-generating enzyme family protein n=1 Tax=Posidoniimonas corsicana TaxID=1938618 RepID=UPI0018D44C8B|nr:SUMF1/EgtB/PvdO family nonheme iron enzyme [Posidoniimonas corsicana]
MLLQGAFHAHSVTEHRLLDLAKQLDELSKTSHQLTEAFVAHQSDSEVRLFVSWIDEGCAEQVFDVIERVFPEATAAHIGDDSSATSRTNCITASMSGLENLVEVNSKTIGFENGQYEFVRGFRIGRECVRVGEFRAFVEATGYQTTAQQHGDQETYESNSAIDCIDEEEVNRSVVTMVSKVDALEYCNWAGVRLPSEAEWLAASVLDWDPLPPGQSIVDALKKLSEFGRLISSGHAEWTATCYSVPGTAVTRSGPRYFLEHDWRDRCWAQHFVEAHYDLMLSFRVVHDSS